MAGTLEGIIGFSRADGSMLLDLSALVPVVFYLPILDLQGLPQVRLQIRFVEGSNLGSLLL